MKDSPLLTTNDVLRLLQISRTTLYRYIADGTLTKIKVGSGRNGAIRFSQDDIDNLKNILAA